MINIVENCAKRGFHFAGRRIRLNAMMIGQHTWLGREDPLTSVWLQQLGHEGHQQNVG
jgi:hypothetical protein